ncbi:MAG: 3-hydroxyacyl-ACP dehydratase FabZ [Myxococcales bacterium]|nr:3-hydroxyacyl-ACP dehydratase FabZ [Myxococcales bacterium]
MTLDFDQICALLPHAYPFVLIDRAVEVVPGQSITALKNVTGTEPFVQGHFPRRALMPGVLMIEAAAQACCLMMLAGHPSPKPLYALGRVERFRFRSPVRPGDQLVVTAKADKVVSTAAIAEVVCRVGEVEVASGRLSFGQVGSA